MKKILSLSALALGTFAVAFTLSHCGGSSVCDDPGPRCMNDSAVTDAAKSACNAELNGSCGSQFKALGECSKSNHSCDSNGMSTSGTACQSQSNAYLSCKGFPTM